MAVAATVDLYTQITQRLLPIPAKFHYTFNLRDVAKVFQGILMTRAQSVSSTEAFARLWQHECARVFSDRLTDQGDRQFFKETAAELMKSKLKSAVKEEEPIFSILLKLEQEVVFYEEVTDKAKLLKVLEDKLSDCNLSSQTLGYPKMNLVFFGDAVSHVLRVARILRQPRGNAMLIGVAGCGKQSLTRLAAFMLDCRAF